MKVVVDGKTYTNFSMISVTSQLNALSRAFEISAELNNSTDIPFRKGQSIVISIGEDRVLTGFIQYIEVENDEKQRMFRFGGHDRMIDVVDSTLAEWSDLEYGTVAGACRAVLSYLGISARVIDLANPSPFNDVEPTVPEAEDTGFDFLSRLAKRKQVLLTSDGDGNMVVTQGIGLRVDGKLVNRADGKGNNLERMLYRTDDSQRFGLYNTQFSQVESATQGATSAEQASGLSAALVDRSIRSQRRRAISQEAITNYEDAAKRAKWEANLRRSAGTTYEVDLATWYDSSGALWVPNTAPVVEDEFADLNGRMLIKQVVYRLTGKGPTASLQLTRPDAFQAEFEIEEEEEFRPLTPEEKAQREAEFQKLIAEAGG